MKDIATLKCWLQMHEQAIEKNPNDARAWFKRGVMLGRLDRLEEALECINHSLELVPKTPDVPTRPAPTSEDDEEWKPDENDDPLSYREGNRYRTLDVLHEKAHILDRMGLKEESLECYRLITDLYPRYTDAWHSLGCRLLSQERFKDALICFERAMKIHQFDDLLEEYYCKQGIEECKKHLQ